MVKHIDEHFVKAETLNALLLGQPGISHLGKNHKLWLAKRLGLISDLQLHSSLVKNFSVIKCHLHTHVADVRARSSIEQYVQCWSRMYCKGSLLANLIALDQQPQQDLTSRQLPPATASPLLVFLKDENRLKQCFWPERWPTSKAVREQMVQQALAVHGVQLDRICANAAIEAVMLKSGWDNALNRMGSKYRANIQVHVCEHLHARVATCLQTLPMDAETPRECIVSLVLGHSRPLCVAQDDFEWAMELKAYFGGEHLDPAPRNVELDERTWALHAWLAGRVPAGARAFSLLPVCKLNRKYAYLDAKIAHYLLGSPDVSTPIADVLDLTRKAFNKTRSKIRAKLRRKHRDGGRQHRKWRKIGHGCFPKHASLHSIETDGVGLCLYLETLPVETPPPAPTKSKRSKNAPPPPRPLPDPCFLHDDALLMGIDEGRVRPFVCTDSDGRTCALTRKHWYKAQRQSFRRRWERGRKVGTVWGEACEALSQAGGFKNVNRQTWAASLEALTSRVPAYVAEHIDSVERARWNMRGWRWKRQALDRAVKRMLQPAISQKRPVVLAVGNASFAPTARGEQAVPTKQLSRAYLRCCKVHRLRFLVLPVDEYNTTQCCHRCGSHMRPTRLASGHDSRRYRTCTQCDKRRNRDVNASKNMLMLGRLELLRQPRPAHLCSRRHHT